MLLVVAVVGIPAAAVLLGLIEMGGTHPVPHVVLASMVASTAFISWTDANIDRGPRALTVSIPTLFGDMAGVKVLLDSFSGWVYALGLALVLWFGLEHFESGVWVPIFGAPLTMLIMFISQIRLRWSAG